MMRHTLKALTCLTAFLILSSAQPARADGFISPWIGANFAQEIGDGHRRLVLFQGDVEIAHGCRHHHGDGGGSGRR